MTNSKNIPNTAADYSTDNQSVGSLVDEWLSPSYPIKKYSTVKLTVEVLRHAFVTHSMFAGTISGVSPFSLPLPSDYPRMREFNRVYYLSFLKNGLQTTGCKNLYFVFNVWGTGYHHFLTEVAVKFPLFEKELREGQILMPPNCPQFVFDFLKLSGFENSCRIKRNCYVKQLKIITNPISGYFDRENFSRLKQFIYERVDFTPNNDFDKIYVSRKHARARKVLNEDELIDALRKKGFKCLELEQTPLAEQINIFRNCRTLLSIHGAAITNAIFMPTGSRIFELYPKQIAGERFNGCYHRLSQALDHQHEYLFCERTSAGKPASLDTDNIYVNVDEVLKVSA